MTTRTGRPQTKPAHPHKVKWQAAQDEGDPESLIKGVILAAIIWPLLVLLLWLGTRHLGSQADSTAVKASRKPSFDIQMLPPDEFLMPRKPTPPPPKFVETNPDAPENIPDKTNNFAAQNQQAAQEKPNPDSKGDHAATEGKKDWESTQIVSGQLTPPTEAPPPVPPPTPEVAAALEKAAEARKAENPLPGFEKREGLSPDGYGMNKAPATDKATAVPEKIEGLKDAPTTVGELSPAQKAIDPRKPQPRVQLTQQRVRPAIFAEDKVGTKNIGLAGYDARWSNYGAYLQRLVDSVQIQFDNIVNNSGVFPPTGTVVTIKFRMDSDGKITDILSAESTGGEQAKSQSMTAITARSPYGKWTDDMVAMLGNSQEFTWKFYYGTP
jgi:hypothetical protein